LSIIAIRRSSGWALPVHGPSPSGLLAPERPSTCVNLMTPYGEQAVEKTEFPVFAEKK
jgi:hypothetical protein